MINREASGDRPGSFTVLSDKHMNRRDFLRWTGISGAMALGGALPALHAAALPPDPFYAHSFADLSDTNIGLDSYLGKPLVLNFWATWCPPCVKEMPDLEVLHKKYDAAHFVGLAVDTAANVRKFGEKVQVSYPLLLAGHGGIKLMRDLGNKQGGLPFTVVFDAQGRIAERILGQVEPAKLESIITRLI